MSEKKVTVTISGSISVSPDPVVLKKNQDNVKWESGGQEFSIVLPSQYPQPTCRREGANKYVCVSGSFDTTGTIKYDVTSPGVPTLDPEMDVVP